MTYSAESDLKYIDGLDDIPVSGPDDFSDASKLQAAEVGEAKLEADVNDGVEIDESSVTVLHGEAAAAWASHKLVYGGESPTSALGGNFVDGSNQDIAEFATSHKETYQNLVASIIDSDADESSKSSDIVFSG